MKSQRKWGLALSWPRVMAVFLVVLALLVLGSHAPSSWQGEHRIAWWVAVGIAVLVTLLSLVSYHGVTMVSGFASWVWDWSADPGTALGAGCTPPVDHQRKFGRDTVGVRAYKGHLVSVIAVDDGEDDAAGRHPRHRAAVASASLPVAKVAEALRQFDIVLDGIDIVTAKVRRGGSAAELSKLEDWGPEEWDLVGDAPPAEQQHTWLVLRMNPQRNVSAVAVRDSLASTLVAATERLAQDLDSQSCAARPLTADELAEVDSTVLADLEPTWSRPGWRHLKHFNGFTTSFWVTPADIDSDNIPALLQAEPEGVGATVLTVRLTERGGRPQISAWVRYHSAERLPREVTAGLNRLTGRQLAAVRASVPAPSTHPLLVVPSRDVRDHDELVLPLDRVREGAVSAPAAQ